MRFGQILGEDLDLVLHGLDDLFHPRGGPLLEDSLYPSGSGDHFLNGAAAEFLDFHRQWTIESAEKSGNRVPLCRFLIVGMQALLRVSRPLPQAQSFLLSLVSVVSKKPRLRPGQDRRLSETVASLWPPTR